MFKQLLVSVMTLGLLGTAPAMALDAGHRQLIDTLESSGVYVGINPPQICDKVKTDKSYHGVYFFSDSNQTPLLGVCQDYGGQGEETEWTENDLDTLRHESIHFIQDCIGDSIDGELDRIYDGPGGYSRIEFSTMDIVSALGYERAQSIISTYEQNDADEIVIALELEAFYLASTQEASDIAEVMSYVCPVK